MIDRNVRHRFFQVLKLLFEETDDDHAITVAQIMERLELRFGTTYKLERRAIYKDIETLTECGLPIEVNTGRSNQKFYRIRNKPFTRNELSLLIHAIYSAKFISLADTESLTQKIKILAGKWDVSRYVDKVRLQDLVKSFDDSNEGEMESVCLRIDDTLMNAIYARLGQDVHLSVPVHDESEMQAETLNVAFGEELVPNLQEMKKRYVDLRFDAKLSDELARWILSLGPDAQVIEPAELRDQVKFLVQSIWRNYE